MDMRETKPIRVKQHNNYRRWTQTEIDYLIENADLPHRELAAYLKRSPKGITGKLRELGKFQKVIKYKTRTYFHYQRHTNECGGIDPIVVDRIVNAGTIEQFALENPVCDCERAYILKYVPDGNRILLFPKPYTRQRLLSIPV